MVLQIYYRKVDVVSSKVQIRRKMKLYVMCRICGRKVYIDSPAKIRKELPYQFSLQCANCYNNIVYYRKDVLAESGQIYGVGGLLVLGGLGLWALGPIGGIVGGLIGAKAGKDKDTEESKSVEVFNNSW